MLATPGGTVVGQTLRAVVYHNDQNHQEAVAAFEKILDLDPELKEMPLAKTLFWAHYTDDLIGSGRLQDARAALKKYLATTQDADLMNRLGQIYVLEGSFEDAEPSFLLALDLNSNQFAPYVGLARLALPHDPKAALEHLQQAKLLAPENTASSTR